MTATTAKGFHYPQATDRVADGATAIQTLATDIDTYLGDWTAYTPTFTNVTGGAGNFRYRVSGKTLFIKGNMTAGTATAAGTIGVSLPAGMTARDFTIVEAGNNNAYVSANIVAGAATVRMFADVNATNIALGASVSLFHFNGVIELA